MIVQRDVKGSALKVGVRGIDCAPTTTPSDLQDIEKG